LSAPIAVGANTTAWLDTDQNAATGFQIFGFAGGAEFNINFDEAGTPHLYTGNAGQTLVSNAVVSFGASSDRRIVEFAVPLTAIGSPAAVNTLWDVNDNTFLPTSFALTQYTVTITPPVVSPPTVVGSVTLDGSLADWSPAAQIDQTLSFAGYDIYAQATGGSLVFALSAPVPVGANTTAWLNTDQNAATGFQIFGFTGGAEFNINFDEAGTPHLYTGNAGQTLVSSATVSFGASADRHMVEFAVPLSAIGSPAAVNTLWDINDNTFLPTSFALTQYTVATNTVPPVVTPPTVVGSVTLDGNIGEWNAANQIDRTLSTAGYDIYAQATGGSLVFAVQAPVAVGENTTAWLNTDQNSATGFQIFGFAGGAEFNIDFDAAGTPRLYTGNGGQTLVSGATVSFGTSADRKTVEFAVPLSAIGSPQAVNTLWDINDNAFLPTSYAAIQYEVVIAPPSPNVGTVTLDGNLGEWSVADQIDDTLSVGGYDIFGKATGGSLVLALDAPVAIAPNTTAWLNTDQDSATGFQVFGFAGGAEFNINFDAAGTPRLYTGDAGQTLVSGARVSFAYSADKTSVELAVPLSAIGSPTRVTTLWDVNDSTFLPTDVSVTEYEVITSTSNATTSTSLSPGTTTLGEVKDDDVLDIGDVLEKTPSVASDSTLFVDLAADVDNAITGDTLPGVESLTPSTMTAFMTNQWSAPEHLLVA
jgi:serralysin